MTNKKIKLIVLSLIALILLSGCSTYEQVPIIVKIMDTGSKIDNIELCYEKALKQCKKEHPVSCKFVRMTSEPICEDGVCLC